MKKLFIIFFAVMAVAFVSMQFIDADIGKERHNFIEQKEKIIGKLIEEGKYQCCLEKPCMYCIEKTPKHGEGATCSCLEDVVNGKAPCGECIGEILEGHGNRYLKEYFPKAIADEIGIEHLEIVKTIIVEKY